MWNEIQNHKYQAFHSTIRILCTWLNQKHVYRSSVLNFEERSYSFFEAASWGVSMKTSRSVYWSTPLLGATRVRHFYSFLIKHLNKALWKNRAVGAIKRTKLSITFASWHITIHFICQYLQILTRLVDSIWDILKERSGINYGSDIDRE